MLVGTEVPDGCKICYYNPDASGNETVTTPVPVPHNWLEENAASLLETNANDYEATASGVAANGRSVWECYLAGVSPTNPAAAFLLKAVSVIDGVPKLEWEPDLNQGGATERTYRVWGRKDLIIPDADEEEETTRDGWTDVTEKKALGMEEGWRFFRVSVELPPK